MPLKMITRLSDVWITVLSSKKITSYSTIRVLLIKHAHKPFALLYCTKWKTYTVVAHHNSPFCKQFLGGPWEWNGTCGVQERQSLVWYICKKHFLVSSNPTDGGALLRQSFYISSGNVSDNWCHLGLGTLPLERCSIPQLNLKHSSASFENGQRAYCFKFKVLADTLK